MKKILLVSIILLIIVVIIFSYISYNKKLSSYDFKIHFFNAGKADCFIINYKDKYIMIDTALDSFYDEIKSYFKKNNINKIDYLIITHFDKDHVGSASKIINNYNVDNIFQSIPLKKSVYYDNYLESLRKKSINPITVENEIDFEIDELKVKVIPPTKIYAKKESNNSSLIVSIEFKNNSLLFTGDIENDRIEDFVNGNNKEYTFLKMSYHGNYQKNLESLLDNVKPKSTVITSSLENIEDNKMIDLLNKKKIRYYLTRLGDIDLYSNGNEIVFK